MKSELCKRLVIKSESNRPNCETVKLVQNKSNTTTYQVIAGAASRGKSKESLFNEMRCWVVLLRGGKNWFTKSTVSH